MKISLIKLIALILVTLNCGCFDSKGSTIMEFGIEIPKTEVIVQESIPIRFRLINDETPVDIPLEYKSSDVVTLSLFDDQETLVARSDGYMKLSRLDPPVERVAQDDMMTETLGADQAMEWEDNLLRYMDIASPGRYFVQARFRFRPGNISLESQKISLEVRENDCNWMDILRDQVSMGMMYFIQQHDAPMEARTLFQISNSFELTAFWEGGVIKLPAGSRPRVSEADFAVQDTFEHDFFRWLVWIEQSRLRATNFTESRFLGRIYEYPLDQADVALVGRPIQHVDRGVSVLMVTREIDRHRVTRLDFDPEFTSTGQSVLASFGYVPRPLSAASDWLGQIYIVAGNAGRLPLQLIEARDGETPKQTEVLSESSFSGLVGGGLRILSAFPDVRVYSWPVRALLVTALLRDMRGRNLKLVRIPLGDEGVEAEGIRVIDVPISDGLLNMGEDIVAADMVQTQKAELHAVFSTSAGNIFYIQQNMEPRKVAQTSVDGSSLMKLVVSGRDDIYVFFPVQSKGIGHQLLYKKIRR